MVTIVKVPPKYVEEAKKIGMDPVDYYQQIISGWKIEELKARFPQYLMTPKERLQLAAEVRGFRPGAPGLPTREEREEIRKAEAEALRAKAMAAITEPPTKAELLAPPIVTAPPEVLEEVVYMLKPGRTLEEEETLRKVMESRLKKGYLTEEEKRHLEVETKTPEEMEKAGWVYEEELKGYVKYEVIPEKKERIRDILTRWGLPPSKEVLALADWWAEQKGILSRKFPGVRKVKEIVERFEKEYFKKGGAELPYGLKIKEEEWRGEKFNPWYAHMWIAKQLTERGLEIPELKEKWPEPTLAMEKKLVELGKRPVPDWITKVVAEFPKLYFFSKPLETLATAKVKAKELKVETKQVKDVGPYIRKFENMYKTKGGDVKVMDALRKISRRVMKETDPIRKEAGIRNLKIYLDELTRKGLIKEAYTYNEVTGEIAFALPRPDIITPGFPAGVPTGRFAPLFIKGRFPPVKPPEIKPSPPSPRLPEIIRKEIKPIITIKPVVKPKVEVEVKPKLKYKEVFKFKEPEKLITAPKVVTIPKPALRITPRLTAAQKAAQVQRQKLLQQQRLISKQATAQALGYGVPVVTIVPRIVGITPLLPEAIPIPPLARPRVVPWAVAKSYVPLVKHKKKWLRVTKKPMRREAALDIAAEAVDRSASARFKIVPSKKEPSKIRATGYFRRAIHKFRPYKLRRGIKIPLKEEYIEKKGHRIDTPGEIRGISAKGWIARRKKARARGLAAPKPFFSRKPTRLTAKKATKKLLAPMELLTGKFTPAKKKKVKKLSLLKIKRKGGMKWF